MAANLRMRTYPVTILSPEVANLFSFATSGTVIGGLVVFLGTSLHETGRILVFDATVPQRRIPIALKMSTSPQKTFLDAGSRYGTRSAHERKNEEARCKHGGVVFCGYT